MPAVRRMFSQTLHYWRTILLVFTAGLSVALLSKDGLAVLLVTLVSAFAFSGYERRRWIIVPANVYATDIFVRVSIALLWTYTLCNTEYGHLLLSSRKGSGAFLCAYAAVRNLRLQRKRSNRGRNIRFHAAASWSLAHSFAEVLSTGLDAGRLVRVQTYVFIQVQCSSITGSYIARALQSASKFGIESFGPAKNSNDPSGLTTIRPASRNTNPFPGIA